ncbi:suppressor of white-apricot isoform X2 [Amblyomma americanum]
MYQEEELKRLNVALNADGTYKETAFSYDSENSAQDSQDAQDEAEVPFKAPKGLHIPASVPTPPTMKLHAIIEKTALFVSQHGAQMEILVKTKQAGNPQFAFLAFDHPLNVYYRFLVEQLKCGTYVPASETAAGNEESDDDDDHYLHPSLFAASTPAVPVAVSKVFLAKQGEDNAYSQLIKNLKPHLDSPTGIGSPAPPQDMEAGNHASAYGYIDGAGYEGYGTGEDCSAPPPPPGLEPILLPSQAVFTGYAIPPPPDVQPIIDKMAVYVAKNGEDFETIVKSKGDKRFEFLLPDHEYHQYYLHKKQTYLNERAQQAKGAAAEAAAPEAVPAAEEREPSPAATEATAKATPETVATEAPAEESYDIVGPKLENGLSVMEDSILASRSNSPFSNIDSNDTNSQPGLAAPTDKPQNKGPVSFTLKLKDADGKEKKRVPLDDDMSDSEGSPSTTAPTVPTVPAEEPAKISGKDKSSKEKQSEGLLSNDRLSPARQLQLERKKRLAKFLSMIKDTQGAAGSAVSSGQRGDGAKASSGTCTPKEPANRLLPDSQRAPADSLPGSPTNITRERSGDRVTPPDSASQRHKSHKSSSKSRHQSRSPASSRHRHRHHHHHGREDPARSRSQERHHRKHHRSPQREILKRPYSKSPSPMKRSKTRRSRSKSPGRRK